MQNGLLSQRPDQGAPSTQPQPQQNPQQAQTPQDDTNGTQEQFDIVAGQMLNYLYSDEGIEGLQSVIKAGDPSKGMAMFIGRLLTMSSQTAVLSGKMIPPNVLFQAGMQLAKGMSEVAQKMGVLTPENEAQATENAFYDGMVQFASEASEEALSQNQRQAYSQLLSKLEQMEQKARGGRQTAPVNTQEVQQ
ncbi:hypothetical protein [Hahella ganghwensis]|uniref:hypothetical protein n=1 Tax=Hahella ganghwensis TaxID=286420 RepID=UPI00037BECD6|nr:hypothetical protein [Hahella ganghwensis]